MPMAMVAVIGGAEAIMRYGSSYLPLSCDTSLHKLMRKWQTLDECRRRRTSIKRID